MGRCPKTLFLAAVLLGLPSLVLMGNPRVVRVGIFQAPPLVLVKDGVPDGLFIDLVKEFARTEGWALEYVEKPWADQLTALKNGEIDLLPAIGFTQGRESIYDFTKDPVFIDSGVLFVSQKMTIRTLFDLEGKRVAALRTSIFTTAFQTNIASFGIHCVLVPTDDNRQVMEAIAEGRAEAGVTIYSLGNYLAPGYPVTLTPITFSPIALGFAVPKGRNKDLVDAVDRRMGEMKGDSGSVYSLSYKKWTMAPDTRGLLLWGVGTGAGLLLVGLALGAWSFFLRREVTAQTRHLSAEKEKLAVTLRSIADGVVTTDTEGRIQLLNPVAESLCGWNQDEAVGLPLETVYRTSRQAGTLTLTARDGTERTISDSRAPIRDSEGRSLGQVLVFQDITERQKSREALQRTDKLESLGLLAGGIAHDFNNLLAGVFGYVALAKKSGGEVPEVVRYLEKALLVSSRAKGLSQQLLTFSSGGIPSKSVGSLEPLIRNSVAFAGSGSNVKCEVSIAPDLRLCEFDQDQLGQVLDNLIINARQAMPDGGRLWVAAENTDLSVDTVPGLKAGAYILISVTDEGGGIPSEMKGRIFDPFFTTKKTGHGLGLAMGNSIVHKHDGAMDFESQVGKGTTFRIYLPSTNQLPGPVQTGGGLEFQGRGTILIMDDEEFIRDILGKELETMGFTVESVKSGQEVLGWFDRPGTVIPRAVFLDLTVPGGMGGKETAQTLRARFPNLPIIASSGFSDDPVVARPTEYGFSGSLRKPYTQADLGQILARFLG